MRIFVLGDSFADNLFAEAYSSIFEYKTTNPNLSLSQISKYLLSLQNENIENAKWWTDWLEEWGYEIVNFGTGGCSNQNIFYQFAKINKEFKEGDRIILHWTDHCRYDWILYSDGRNASIHPNINVGHLKDLDTPLKLVLSEHTVNIDTSFKSKNGYLNNNLIPFMDWIVEKHSEYNPIVWSTFQHTSKHLNKSRLIDISLPYLVNNLKNLWSIKKECNNLFNDSHFGRYGNYYMAVLFDEIIKNGITINLNDTQTVSHINHIIKIAVERIKNENLIFTNPTTWPEEYQADVITPLSNSTVETIPPNIFSKWITQKHKNWLQ